MNLTPESFPVYFFFTSLALITIAAIIDRLRSPPTG